MWSNAAGTVRCWFEKVGGVLGKDTKLLWIGFYKTHVLLSPDMKRRMPSSPVWSSTTSTSSTRWELAALDALSWYDWLTPYTIRNRSDWFQTSFGLDSVWNQLSANISIDCVCKCALLFAETFQSASVLIVATHGSAATVTLWFCEENKWPTEISVRLAYISYRIWFSWCI